ncbi:hypothetical protein BTJ40_06640 [Microbulbifer sp. A4B17]|uniref:hypothetical protein n=1 Tax=Microbulbifer sp. A4B17 TaxID=359370 RepID=UPI000D52C79E|nr:hypothetical protein [Microbulbifer sp. A4B17]AWF80512.1 hypothetical protein BTJ40_06640 [Microbulbifer sp. A4B17]
MDKIELQRKTKAKNGKVEAYWFENESIGLQKTLFHRITIPLEPFDSGLEYEEQPLSTEIVLDWYELNLENSAELDGANLSHESYPEAGGSVYVGCAHNWCNVKELVFSKANDGRYEIKGSVVVEFENEGVAQNEPFTFETTIEVVTA